MRKAELVIIALIIASVLIGWHYYPQLPERIDSHWNSAGEADGTMSRFWGVALFPLIGVGIAVLFVVLPRIDPLRRNVERFRGYFDGFMVLMMLYLMYIYVLTLLWNTGSRFDMGQYMLPALGVLFFYIGVMLSKSKRNWFIGIRTPWTMSSDGVWDQTHARAGVLFKAMGVVAVLATFLPSSFALWATLGVIFAGISYIVLYSYLLYRREQGKHKERRTAAGNR